MQLGVFVGHGPHVLEHGCHVPHHADLIGLGVIGLGACFLDLVAGGIALFAQGRAPAFKLRIDDQVHNALCAPENEGRRTGPMTITDPTILHSPTRSIVSKATQWTIDALAPLREHLSAWPAVLPSEVGDPAVEDRCAF